MAAHKKNGQTTPDLYKNWFLDYASYVVLERAIPALEDGLKPVQRRILHAMHTMEDGRYNKVASLIGTTMQFHPHGDAAIGDAITHLGQKDLLIDTQGNWGNTLTGDAAAAPRYIECRLSPFALAVAFNDKITQWTPAYDGRKKEPVRLPIKFPLLLAQGAEGIAVGLSTKILPHNFCELIAAAIKILKGEDFTIYPDFPTGGTVDVSEYADGKRGGKVKLRATIHVKDKDTLVINSLPHGVTTPQLIQSILKASEQGKVSIKKIADNTAQQVEILLILASQASAHKTLHALYAFTLCEVTIFPCICVIKEDKPAFLSVSELLRSSTLHTKQLLQAELLVEQEKLQENLMSALMEKLFIIHKIYRHIEECTTWQGIIDSISTHLTPHLPKFHRAVNEEDIVALTAIKIKRISKYDRTQAARHISALTTQLKDVQRHLKTLTQYTIDYFTGILARYGKGKERKSALQKIAAINTTEVLPNDKKIYLNKKEGFIGYGLKKEPHLLDCSVQDRLIVFKRDGSCCVVQVEEKLFVGKHIIHVAIFRRENDIVYNMVYVDGVTHRAMVKCFKVGGIILQKNYLLAPAKGSKVLYLHAQHEEKATCMVVLLSPQCQARKKKFNFDFSSIAMKGKEAKGNILSRFPIQKITAIKKKEQTATPTQNQAPREKTPEQQALFEE